MTAAEPLRARMTRSKTGWTTADLDRLYRGYGFEVREGSKHRPYWHPRFPELRAAVTRSSPLASGYVRAALALLDRLDELTVSLNLHEGDR